MIADSAPPGPTAESWLGSPTRTTLLPSALGRFEQAQKCPGIRHPPLVDDQTRPPGKWSALGLSGETMERRRRDPRRVFELLRGDGARRRADERITRRSRARSRLRRASSSSRTRPRQRGRRGDGCSSRAHAPHRPVRPSARGHGSAARARGRLRSARGTAVSASASCPAIAISSCSRSSSSVVV